MEGGQRSERKTTCIYTSDMGATGQREKKKSSKQQSWTHQRIDVEERCIEASQVVQRTPPAPAAQAYPKSVVFPEPRDGDSVFDNHDTAAAKILASAKHSTTHRQPHAGAHTPTAPTPLSHQRRIALPNAALTVDDGERLGGDIFEFFGGVDDHHLVPWLERILLALRGPAREVLHGRVQAWLHRLVPGLPPCRTHLHLK